MSEEEYLTIQEAAERYKVHRNTVQNWLRRGLPRIKQGRIVRISVAEIERWLRENDQGKTEAA